MADDNRWNDRDRDWRDDRSWQGRGRGRGGGNFGRGGEGGRGYAAQGSPDAEQRWRQMHQDRSHEGPAGYNDSGPAQGGWEFGDEAQGGERGQGYERYGYGRGPARPFRSQGAGHFDEYGRDPGVGSAYGETWGAEREYGRGGGYGAAGRGSQGSQTGYAGQGGYGMSAGGGGYEGGRSQYGYGAHTPYGYRGSNEYDQRGRGGQYASGGERGGEDRSWLERAGEKVAGFFGAEDTGSHRGRGPKGYTRSDERIREDISDRLTDDPWLDASNIDVQVAKCEVTLTGTVTSREDKRRAEDLAEAISGVRHVQNSIRVEDGRGSDTFEGARTQPGQTAMGEQATTQAAGRTNNRDQKGGATHPHAPDSAPGLNT